MNLKTCFSLVTVLAVAVLVALPVAPVYAAGGTYTVRPGETLSGIASRYGVSVEALRAANNLGNANQITAGMVLVIPSATQATAGGSSQPGSAYSPGGSYQSGSVAGSSRSGSYGGGCSSPYIVQSGDSLSTIAARCGVSTGALAAANGLGSTSKVFVGQRLIFPSSTGGGGYSSPNARATPEPSSGRAACTNPYVVRSGDTLGSVAARCGVSAENLRRWNNLWSNTVWPGLRLITQGPFAAPATSTRVPAAGSVPLYPASPTPRMEPTIAPW
ncbi:MAG: LysM peptidoglycan-binding domain-containing protein [Chloroflexi bacterium]|nr:LysM peptidoglycan-binding domain-containing protein [Chloroflexota bacterium]